MPPIRSRRRLLAGVAAAALAAVAACTHEPTAPVSAGSTNPALSLPEANMMGEAVAADAQSELDGATLSSGTFLPGLGAPISTFTADAAGSIQPDARLPSGTLSIDGTSTWTHGTNSYALTVSTNPVLHYNASCTARPKFDAGTLKTTVTRNSTTSTVTIAFTACGQYTVTRS